MHPIIRRIILRRLKRFLLSNGVDPNRRAEWTIGAAGAVAGLPLPLPIPFELDVPTSNPSTTAFIFAFTPLTSGDVGNTGNVCIGYITTAGLFTIRNNGAIVADNRRMDYASFRAAYSGQKVRGMIVFESGNTTTNPKIYINGVDVSASFALTTAGTPPNWLPLTLDTTKFLVGHNWTAGRIVPHSPIIGALTAAEVLEWTQTGRLPTWCELGTGSAVAQTSGTLRIGSKYRILSYLGSDNFTNVGAASNATGVEFIATGTTPTTWTSSSQLLSLGPIFRPVIRPGSTIIPDSGSNLLDGVLFPGLAAKAA